MRLVAVLEVALLVLALFLVIFGMLWVVTDLVFRVRAKRLWRSVHGEDE